MHYLYRMGLEMQQEAVDERVRGWARTVSAVSVEALLAASQGRRLSFDPDYAPAEYEDGPPLTLYRRGGAGRARGGRQGGRASPVGHRLVDKDDDEDSLLSVATLSTSRGMLKIEIHHILFLLSASREGYFSIEGYR